MNQSPGDNSRGDKKIYREYGFAILAVAACTAICFAVFPYLKLINLAMIFLLGTLAVAVRGSRGASALASTLGVLAYDFFFVPPRFLFSVSDTQYIVTFIVMFIVTMVVNHLTVRVREEAKAARASEQRTVLIHEFSQELANTPGMEAVLNLSVQRTAKTFEADVDIFLPAEGGKLEVKTSSKGGSTLNEKEKAVSQWVFDSGEAAGLGTQILPETGSLFLPLFGSESQTGVMKITPREPDHVLNPAQRVLLDSFAHQIGLALDVDRLQSSTRKAEVEAETERLRSSLLSSVSHDLRTPLAAILGSASALLERHASMKPDEFRGLLENVQSEGERLSRLIQNLLEATRLETGEIKVKKELIPLEEPVGSALERIGALLNKRKIDVQIPESLPAVPMDPILMEQVLINLLENAVRHTPPETGLEISAEEKNKSVIVTIADFGPGIQQKNFERVFDKFFRGETSRGAGLGLAICRAIIKAHGGRIWAENIQGYGAVFRFTLPLE